MTKHLRLLALAAALGSPLLYSSCADKGDDPKAQTQTAVLSGQITPAASATSVTATSASGTVTAATVTATGAYTFPALPVGVFTLNVTPAAGWVAPAPVTVTLAAGGTTAPAITLSPVTATLSGVVQPLGAATLATATNASGTAVTATPNPNNGAYSFPGLPVGTYRVAFTPAEGFGAPAPTSVVLVAPTTTVPTTTLFRARPEASFTVDGQPVVATGVIATPVGGDIAMLCTATTAAGNIQLFFILSGQPVIGTRPLDGLNIGSYHDAMMREYDTSTGSGGTFTIASHNPAIGSFSGTFSFVGVLVNGSATRTITNGTFTNVDY